MRRREWLFLAAMVVAPTAVNAQRKPLTVKPLTRIEHRTTAPRQRLDSVRGKMVEYAVDGKIELLPNGDFLLSWNGSRGNRLKIVWEPPNKLAAVIAAEVKFDSAARLFTYAYTVRNEVASLQKLQSVSVGAVEVSRAARPDSTWYSIGLTPFLKTTFGMDGWRWSQVFHDQSGIPPGESVAGFSIISRRPPGIVKAYVEGQAKPLMGVGEELVDELHEAINRVYFTVPAGVTIGPAAKEFSSAIDELRDILVMLNEAEQQGWLGTPTSAQMIRSAVTAIRSSVLDSDTVRASQQTAALLRNLRTQPYEGVLSEGRALLEFRLRRTRLAL